MWAILELVYSQGKITWTLFKVENFLFFASLRESSRTCVLLMSIWKDTVSDIVEASSFSISATVLIRLNEVT